MNNRYGNIGHVQGLRIMQLPYAVVTHSRIDPPIKWKGTRWSFETGGEWDFRMSRWRPDISAFEYVWYFEREKDALWFSLNDNTKN